MNRKVVFFVYNIHGIGGTVRTIVNQANFLVSKGFTVDIVSLRFANKVTKFDIDPRINLIDLFTDGKDKKNEFFETPSEVFDATEPLFDRVNKQIDNALIEAIESYEDAFLVSTIPSISFALSDYAHENAITIAQEHSEIKSFEADVIEKMREKYNKLNYIITLNEASRAELQRMVGVSKEQTLAIPNGIQVSKYTSTNKNKTMLTIGRLSEEKGFDRIPEIFSLISDEYPDWEVRIHGVGSEKEVIQSEINKYYLGDKVHIFPSTQKPDRDMAEGSIYLVPSRFESFGLTIIEALSAGLVPIAYKTQGSDFLIKDGYNGLLFEQDDVEGFAAGLSDLISNPEKRQELVRNGQATVNEYSMNTIGEKWVAFYEGINNDATV
ncbi:glycosyltransferase [Weissella ceti]|uniref:Glycosyltransferase n=1 Tax=Weissella ceti TaxID=759620 RepID=A0ABT3E3E1_9LACO|nr:glycosyltransferase [Weissella ceti]MCW0952941.1 glycosyltransferase [Weissella ceti]QVK11487.1 glycosyltransferase [Weissella ceti]